MLACTEAMLRVDFIVRVGNKKRDELSRRFRSVSKERESKIRLGEDILDGWRRCSEGVRVKNAVQEFKGVLNLRDWLAHGRYWKPRLAELMGTTRWMYSLSATSYCKQSGLPP